MSDDEKRPDCKYGKNCYRKNPDHQEKYAHPKKSQPEASSEPETSPESYKSPSPAHTETVAAEPENVKNDDHDDHKTLMQLYDPYDEAAEKALKIQLAELVRDRKKFIRQMFFAVFPPEFYEFWEFCKATRKENPEKILEPFGLKLVGPFDVLAGKFDDAPLYKPREYLTHWRFFYDVPEFQTVLVKDKTEIHYGYWRDVPLETPEQCLIARNDSSKGCEMKMIAANIFQAVLYYLENDFISTPFNAQQAKKMKKSIEDWANSKEISLTNAEELINAREEKIVCRTLHRAGLVAPYNRKTKLGYRPLQVSDAMLKKILGKFDKVKREDAHVYAQAMEGLHPVITAADIAMDEKDTATPLELGIDLFCSGHEVLHELCRLQIITGYTALERPQYIAILKTHLESRRKGFNLDLLKQKN